MKSSKIPNRLTDEIISELYCSDGLKHEYPDGMSLYLAIHPSNRKVWNFRFLNPLTKKPACLVIGPYVKDQVIDHPNIGDPHTLEQARKQMHLAKRELSIKRDPRSTMKNGYSGRYASQREVANHLLLHSDMFRHLRDYAREILLQVLDGDIREICMRYGFHCNLCSKKSFWVSNRVGYYICRECEESFYMFSRSKRGQYKHEEIEILWLAYIIKKDRVKPASSSLPR